MRKYFLLVYLFLSSVAFTSGQAFQGGMMAGIVASQVAGDTYSGFDKAGAFFGGYVRLPLSGRWAGQLEMEYFQKGSRHNYNPDNSSDKDFRLRADYVEMPLLLQYDMSVYIKNLVVQAGPSLGVLVFKKVKYDGQDVTAITNGFHAMNLCSVFGVRYFFGPQWSVDFRTSNSLVSMRTGKANGFVKRLADEYGQFHDALVISLFYKF